MNIKHRNINQVILIAKEVAFKKKNVLGEFKILRHEDPELTCFHRHNKSTLMYGIIPSEREQETG